MAAPGRDFDTDTAKEVVDFACEAVDYAEAQGAPTETGVSYIATRSKTALSYRIQIQEIADSLVRATSSGQQEAILGRAALCLAASSK